MDKADYAAADMAMGRRVEAVFGDPARHQFYSVFEEDEAVDRRGPRGGRIRGRKTMCTHCGRGPAAHTDKTEAL